MARPKKKAHKSWTEGKTQEEIDAVIAKRKATRKKNLRKGTTVKLQAKAKKLKKATKRRTKSDKETFVNITVLRGKKPVQPYYVGVRFKGTVQTYTYMTDIPGIQKDDKVVVLAPGGYEVVTVLGVQANKPNSAYGHTMKWLVDKVDTEAYKLREQLATRKAQLVQQIAAKKRSLIENQDLDVLAQYDPEIGELAEELRSLGG